MSQLHEWQPWVVNQPLGNLHKNANKLPTSLSLSRSTVNVLYVSICVNAAMRVIDYYVYIIYCMNHREPFGHIIYADCFPWSFWVPISRTWTPENALRHPLSPPQTPSTSPPILLLCLGEFDRNNPGGGLREGDNTPPGDPKAAKTRLEIKHKQFNKYTRGCQGSNEIDSV